MTITKNSTFIQSIVALASIFLLVFIIRQADWSYFSRVEISFQPFVILLTIISTACLFFLRTLTFFLFLPKSVNTPYKNFLLPSSKYQLLSLVTPMHAADLLLPFMFGTATNTGIAHNFMMVYVFRLTDLFVLFAIFLLSSKFITGLAMDNYEIILYLALVSIAFLYLYPFTVIKVLLKVAEKLFAYLNYYPVFFDKINKQVDSFSGNLALRNSVLIMVSVIMTWLAFALMYYYVFDIFGFKISFIETLFCVAMVNIASLIPIQTFGGIGLRESTLLLGLLMLGIGIDLAAGYAITVRLTVLSFQLTIFFLIFLLLSIIDRKNKQKI